MIVSRQSLHSMTSCPPADRRSLCSLYFWRFRRDNLHVTPQSSSTIRHNIEIFHVMLTNLVFSWSVWCSAKLFDLTFHYLCVRCTIRHYAEPFHATLHSLYVRCTVLVITSMISYYLSPEGEGERFFGESYGLQGELSGYQSSLRESKGLEGGRKLLNFEC